METFTPQWYTIPEFQNIVPIRVYHKETQAAPKQPDPGKRRENMAARLRNLHVLARAGFSYEKGTGKRYIWITADDYYKLYVNGVYAGQGPAPAYPEKYYYNEIDITPFLQDGRNVLAVHLYYQGLINRVWNSGDGRFGIACRMMDEKGHETEPVWKYKVSDAYSGETIGYETQYLENFDSRLWQEDWSTLEYDDSMWEMMAPAVWADYTLHKQPVKMLDVYTVEPKEIRQESGVWKLDFGRELAGALRIRAHGTAGRQMVIRCGEECRPDGSVCYDMRCNCKYEEVWTLKDGECLLEPYDYKGFRYAELSMEPDIHILDVRAVVRHYPLEERLCTVRSSDKRLEEIFCICKNAVKLGTQEGYLDCPTREKGQYLGDAVVTSLSQVWLTGTVEMLRKCIDQFAQTAEICPGLMAVAPGALMQEIADFSLLWPKLLLTDYQFTGDKQFLAKYYQTARGVLNHFRKYARDDGLLVTVADKWNLVDWPENLRDGYDFELSRPTVAQGCHNVVNALYIGAVGMVSRIGQILGKKDSYDFMELKKSYIQEFYCPEKQLFLDSGHSRHTSLHSNVYALYFGLCPAGSEGGIADFLVEKGLCCGTMLSFFYLKALARCGRYHDVYQTIVNDSKYGWMNMVREGASACFEAWGKEQKWNTSLCHPWASAPIPVLIEDIAGFVPDPGRDRGFCFKPHIPEEVRELSVTVPFRGIGYTVHKGEM